MTDYIPQTVPLYQCQLAYQLNPTDTSATLTPENLISGSPLPAGSLICMSVDIGQPNPEYILGTITANVVTFITRNCDPLDPTVTIGTFTSVHGQGAVVKITDFATIQMMRNLLNGTKSLQNVLRYNASQSFLTPYDLVDKEYVLSVVNGGPVTFNALVVTGTAGENFSQGACIYLKVADGKWYNTVGTDVTTLFGIQLGIAQSAGTTGSSITKGVLLRGVDTNNTGTAGSLVYCQDTAGTLGATTGTVTKVVGQYIIGSAGLYFNPEFYDILTPSQKSAINSIPSGSNLTIPMGEAFTGATTPQPAVIINDLFQSRIDGMYVFGGNSISQKQTVSITPQSNITSSSLQMILSKVGTPSDNVKITIETDNSGAPSGTPVANGTSNTVAGTGLSATVPNMQTFTFASPFTLTKGTKYWVVIQRDSTLSDGSYYLVGGLLVGATTAINYASFIGLSYYSGSWQSTTSGGLGGTCMPYVDILPSSGSGSLSLWQAQSTATPDYMKNAMGICVSTGSAGSNGIIYLNGNVGGFSGLIPETDYYVSSSKGQITTTAAGQYIGTAISATQINIPTSKTGNAYSYGQLSGTTVGAYMQKVPFKAPFNGTFVVVNSNVNFGSLASEQVTITISDDAGLSVNVKTYYVSNTTGSSTTANTTGTIPIRKGQYMSVSTTTSVLSFIPQF